MAHWIVEPTGFSPWVASDPCNLRRVKRAPYPLSFILVSVLSAGRRVQQAPAVDDAGRPARVSDRGACAGRGRRPPPQRAEGRVRAPGGERALGVTVQSLESGEVLYEQNAHRLLMPASNMKIVTMAVAAERLGWDYRFPTTFETAGTIANGVLTGDLVVVGHGDPTIGERGGPRTRVFEQWADKLRELGITRVDGRLIGDDDAFDDDTPGEGWPWDDLTAGYAAAPAPCSSTRT